jgi:hypothetical protein
MHAAPQAPQFPSLLCRSTQEPLHSVGACGGHPDAHPKTLPPSIVGAQNGVPPAHVTPQVPQFGLADRSVGHPAPESEQSARPRAH